MNNMIKEEDKFATPRNCIKDTRTRSETQTNEKHILSENKICLHEKILYKIKVEWGEYFSKSSSGNDECVRCSRKNSYI